MHATAVHVLPGMLRYLGVAEDDIDDLSQEVLLGAYTSLPRYNPAYPASARGSAAAAGRLAASPGLRVRRASCRRGHRRRQQQEQDDPASLPPPAPGIPSAIAPARPRPALASGVQLALRDRLAKGPAPSGAHLPAPRGAGGPRGRGVLPAAPTSRRAASSASPRTSGSRSRPACWRRSRPNGAPF